MEMPMHSDAARNATTSASVSTCFNAGSRRAAAGCVVVGKGNRTLLHMLAVVMIESTSAVHQQYIGSGLAVVGDGNRS